jgi:hypothetical protein
MNPSNSQELWLPTGEAARQLGISADTLKRWSDPRSSTHCLQSSTHFRRGKFANSPIRWRVDLIERVIDERTFPAPLTTATPLPVEEA